MRRRYSRDQWRSWIDEQAASGLSIKGFCQQKEISEKSFYLWRKKLGPSPSPSAPVFVPVSVVDRGDLEVHFARGIIMRVPCDPASVRCVVDALCGGGPEGC